MQFLAPALGQSLLCTIYGMRERIGPEPPKGPRIAVPPWFLLQEGLQNVDEHDDDYDRYQDVYHLVHAAPPISLRLPNHRMGLSPYTDSANRSEVTLRSLQQRTGAPVG